MIDHFVLHQMLGSVKKINPDYPADSEMDYGPLRKIATFLLKQAQAHDGPADPGLFIQVWDQVYKAAYNDPFYKDKSLATISNHIQEFFQKAKNNNGKLTNSKLKDKLAARLNKQ